MSRGSAAWKPATVLTNTGKKHSNATVTIGGNLTAGPDGIEAGPLLRVAGDLTSGGPLGRAASTIEVEGAARVAGDVAIQRLSVGGTLITPPGASVVGEILAPARESAEVRVPPPCRCQDAIDVAGLIEQHVLVNYNAEIDLSPDRLRNVTGDAELELPCGWFYLDEVSGQGEGTIAIRAGGRTALFVAGNITIEQSLTVELDPGAELDLFVAGFIQSGGTFLMGDAARPRSLRVYVASRGSIDLSSGSVLAGNLYAPVSDVASSAPLEIYGALVVNHVNGAATVNVHYDGAIAQAADECAD